MNGIILLNNKFKSYYNSKYEIEALMPYFSNMEIYNILYCLEEGNISIGGIDKYLITIYTDLTETFEELTSEDKKEHIIKDYIKNTKYKQHLKELRLIMEKYKGHEKDILKDANIVVMNFDIKKSLEYLKQNKELYNKKIVINASIYEEFNKKEVSEIIKNIPNLYIKIEQNSELITFEEFIKTKEIIDNIVKEIETFNFSPLEQIMYAYDIAKDHIYKKENEGENENVSRNLTSVLLGDKIVCVGYAEVFNTILNKLGIKSNIVALDNIEKKPGHAINTVYIKDEKYNINGVYYFDPTGDRKKDENSDLHMLQYKYFARTISQRDLLEKKLVDRNTKVITPYIKMSSPEEASLKIVRDISDLLFYYEVFGKSHVLEKLVDIIKSINHLSSLSGSPEKIKTYLTIPSERGKLLDTLQTQIKPKVENTLKYFMKPINVNTLIKALYNVRKQQYYNNPEKYPFSKEDFLTAILKSDWLFDETIKDIKEKRIKNEEIKDKQEKYYLDYLGDTTLEKDISRVKLVRTLKTISEKKQR